MLQEAFNLGLNLAEELSLLSGVPGLSKAAGIVSASVKAAQEVKVYKRQCGDLNSRCVKLLLAVQENQEDYPTGRLTEDNVIAMAGTQQAYEEMNATILRIHGRIAKWGSMNMLQSIMHQSTIKEAIEFSYKEIDNCFQCFQINVYADQSRAQRELAAIQAKDQAEIRHHLQHLTASLERLHSIVRENRPEVPALMQSIQEELHNVPTLEPAQKTSFRAGLRELRKETSLLPPLTDLTGQVGSISQQAAVLGGSADIHTGMWLDDEKVALKRHRLFNTSPSARKRFVKEVEIWRQLQHEHILPFYGITYNGDYVYTVSPWMDNGNAKDYLERHPGESRLRVFRQIAEGMEYLHEHKVIHGDLRGGNVLICASGKACISDFGLSKVLEEIDQGTQSSVILGSLRWLAPEVIKPEVIGEREVVLSAQTDSWSFGMTLLELSTNAHPFAEIPRDFSVSQALSDGQLPRRPPPNPQLRGLDNELWGLMLQCWDSDPHFRPSMTLAKEMLKRLERVAKRASTLSSALNEMSLLPRSPCDFTSSHIMLPVSSPTQGSPSSSGGTSLPKESYMPIRQLQTPGGSSSRHLTGSVADRRAQIMEQQQFELWPPPGSTSRPATGDRQQTLPDRPSGRHPVYDRRLSATDRQSPIVDRRQSVTDHQPLTMERRTSAADSQPSSVDRRTSTTDRQPSSDRWPHTADPRTLPNVGTIGAQGTTRRHGLPTPLTPIGVPENEVPSITVERGGDRPPVSPLDRRTDRQVSRSSSSGSGSVNSTQQQPRRQRSYNPYDPYEKTAPLPPLHIPATPDHELAAPGEPHGEQTTSSPGTEARSSPLFDAPFASDGSSTSPPAPSIMSSKTDPGTSTSPQKRSFFGLGRKPKEPVVVDHLVFGKALAKSLVYAKVEVPMMLGGGQTAYSALPIVVTKCGYWLKVYGLQVVGLFRRRDGGARRMKQLQTIFETPPNFGRLLDMKGDYDVFDVAGVLRKFLHELPEPVVPLEFYPQFIDSLKSRTEEEKVSACGQVLLVIPSNNADLLMYMLDLMATFAKNSSKNLMSVKDLVETFQPELLHHPDRSWWDGEERRCQKVLEFMVQRLPQLLAYRHLAHSA